MQSHRRNLLIGLSVVVVLLAVGLVTFRHSNRTPVVSERYRQSNSPFYADPGSHAAKDLQLARQTSSPDATDLAVLAVQPTGIWFTGGTRDDALAKAQKVATDAASKQKIPILVAYNVPVRDCQQFSAGGAINAGSYYDYIGAIGAGIGSNPAWVVLEPDAIAHAIAGCTSVSPSDRYAMLAEAVRILKLQPKVHVYLDAGNADWITDTKALASALKQAGLEPGHADGFALNTSNFQTTAATVDYGDRLSRALGGARYVIDTSRNGNGPYHSQDANKWCNPPGRALGDPPTTQTGHAAVDAYLWIKIPGDSDGQCHPGDPVAGQWWRSYAVGLVKRARP